MTNDQHPTDDRSEDNIDPEPLDIDADDVANALPHGDNPHPPSESDVQVPG